ncbi:MAG: hypothetical protein JOY86_07895 [Candidatus Eremiobacteraeota bacterium]|nr:hypothetical protein [Candidatus Eremiobacteraeota bacterium]
MPAEQDMNQVLMVDGNAVAGGLQQLFGRDMTIVGTRCAGCARSAEIGALMAFVRGPGAVLRCPACQTAIVRIVETPAAQYVDVRGAAYLRFRRSPSR